MKKIIKKIRNKLKITKRKELEKYCFEFHGGNIDQEYLDSCDKKKVQKTFMHGLEDIVYWQLKEKKEKIKFLKLILKNLENRKHNYK